MKIIELKSKLLDCKNYLLIKDGNALLIDASVTPQDVSKNLGNAKLAGILLTHMHFDHIYMLETLMKHFGVFAYARNCCKNNINLEKVNKSFLMPELFFEPKINVKNLIGLAEGNIKIKNFNVKVLETAGHSECGLCFVIDNCLFAGDTIFKTGIGRTDLEENGKEKMAASLNKLLNLTNYEKVYCGHGDNSNFAQQQKNMSVFLKFITRDANH